MYCLSSAIFLRFHISVFLPDQKSTAVCCYNCCMRKSSVYFCHGLYGFPFYMDFLLLLFSFKNICNTYICQNIQTWTKQCSIKINRMTFISLQRLEIMNGTKKKLLHLINLLHGKVSLNLATLWKYVWQSYQIGVEINVMNSKCVDFQEQRSMTNSLTLISTMWLDR